ncbi:two-component system sensor kinase [Streptomyces davaonensis JCM 4913]|uniref:histidine kinase n=1 Tax=Streptomyces davaonensis (strain DSM 101723 / JCM 4913 / KCC S-0913 / 768) TaxID=1214101 RepID=K4RAL8_STRDJ|nr:HAMP domain-containing sensor histidine kinase [Streptomyces davaonensis]CCK30210.1 two-component system sensor kinase [Streptomyces davaonensis JCM 4913]
MTRRLLASYLCLTALVLLCLEIPLGFRYAADERDRAADAARDEAESAAAYTALSLATGRAGLDLTERAVHCAERVGGKVVIVDGSGGVLAASHPVSRRAARALPARPGIAAALKGSAAMDVRTAVFGGAEHLSVTAPVVRGAEEARGAVWLIVPTQTARDRIGRAWLLLGAGGLGVLTAVSVIGLGLARWAGRPIRELERATHALADGDATAPVPVTKGPPEVRRLAAAFNRTAARLAHLLASQHAFAGEASHQLKTPLAALRLRLENLEPDVCGPGRGSLAAAVTETDRLARMVEGLLAMARLEEDAATPGPVDVGAVCVERHRTWLPLFEREGVALVLFAGSVGPVLAVPGAVEQILDNLLSNALRASPSGSTVTIELRLLVPAKRALRDARPCWVDLHVTDEGPGMTPEQRQRAFDRFWRAPGAPKGGTGLGLSLVQRLSVASGGAASLHAAATGGLDAVVRLPSAELPTGTNAIGRQGTRRREAPPLPA